MNTNPVGPSKIVSCPECHGTHSVVATDQAQTVLCYKSGKFFQLPAANFVAEVHATDDNDELVQQLGQLPTKVGGWLVHTSSPDRENELEGTVRSLTIQNRNVVLDGGWDTPVTLHALTIYSDPLRVVGLNGGNDFRSLMAFTFYPQRRFTRRG